MIRTQKLNWSAKAGLAGAGFSGGNRPKSNGPGFSCGKTRCNGSVPIPTLTRNRSSGLEPLLTLIRTRVTRLMSDRAYAYAYGRLYI